MIHAQINLLSNCQIIITIGILINTFEVRFIRLKQWMDLVAVDKSPIVVIIKKINCIAGFAN